jgi:hypothetical protein
LARTVDHVEPQENEARVGKKLWGALLGGNATADVDDDENPPDEEEGDSGERGGEDEGVSCGDEGSRSEWYVGAAEVQDGAAERMDAVLKSGMKRRLCR